MLPTPAAIDCSSNSALTGALRLANASDSHSVVNSPSRGSGLSGGSIFPRSSDNHSLPNLRPSTNRNSRPSSSANVWRVMACGSCSRGCTTKLPVMPRWATRVVACPEPVEGPARGNSRYLARRPTSLTVQPTTEEASSPAEGCLTVLAQPMSAPVMVRPARPDRRRLRRTLSTSGSSGIAKPYDSTSAPCPHLSVIARK